MLALFERPFPQFYACTANTDAGSLPSQLNATPICFSLRQTTVHGRGRLSISRTSVNSFGMLIGDATSTEAPDFEMFRTMQVIVPPPPTLINPAFNTRRRGARRLSSIIFSPGLIAA